jgi:DNA-binding CsgD family transcriptional regulator
LPAAQIELIITNLMAQGMTTARIGIRLAQLGLRAEAIAKQLGVSAEVAQSYVDIVEAELALAAALAESAGDSTLQAEVEKQYPSGPGRCANAIKDRRELCANPRGNTPAERERLPKDCGDDKKAPMPPIRLNGTRDCSVFMDQKSRHLACAAARVAILLYCPQTTDPNRKGHIEAAIGAWNGVKKCQKRWQECMEPNQQCGGK